MCECLFCSVFLLLVPWFWKSGHLSITCQLSLTDCSPTSCSCPPHLSFVTADSPISYTCVPSSLHSRLKLQVHRCSVTVICVSSQSINSNIQLFFLCAASLYQKADITWKTATYTLCLLID